MRVLEEPVAEALVVGRRVVAHDPRHQPADRLEHHHGGHLSPAEHVVADRQLAVDQVLAHPLVDALVAAAQQAEAIGARQLAGPALVETAARRAQVEQRSRRLSPLDRREHRLGHEHHAGPATEGRVVHAAVRIRGDGAEVVDPDVEHAGLLGLAEQALAGEALDHGREDGEDVDPHARHGAPVRRPHATRADELHRPAQSAHAAAHQRSNRPSGGSMVRAPSVVLGDEHDRHQRAGVEHEQVAGRVGLHLRDRAHRRAVEERHGRADELVHPQVVVVVIVDGLGAQHDTAPRVGLLADVDALEVDDPPVLVGRRAHDGQRRRGRCAAPCRDRAARCARW